MLLDSPPSWGPVSTSPLFSYLEKNDDVIVIYDKEWKLVYANSAWEKTTGRSRYESKGLVIWEMFPSLAQSELGSQYMHAMATQQIVTWLYQVHPQTGTWLDVHAYPAFDGILLSAHDCTVLRKAEILREEQDRRIQELHRELEGTLAERTRTLHKEREFNNWIVTEITDGVMACDTDWILIEFNPIMEIATGLKRNDVLGKSLYDVFPEFKHPLYVALYDSVMNGVPAKRKVASVVPVDLQPPLFRLLLSEFWERAYTPIISKQDKTVLGVIFFYRDVTLQKKAQAEITLARDEALHLARAKSDFLANMSHEIRTPLNAVIGVTELLTTKSLDEGQQSEAYTIMHNSSQALMSIINQVLDFSKYEAGKMTLQNRPFVLGDLFTDVVQTFRLQAYKKSK
eukprot:TRINITY_DN4518_c0_g2_i1.p1 TRINITY_DN4518_c0_g2~~TRINITY_DN4518_c0_g2_i1.p1  ORF type:complete len:399 (+),score=35.62 TRINITY_DN4518_c0_g2_i1:30-1226(+)